MKSSIWQFWCCQRCFQQLQYESYKGVHPHPFQLKKVGCIGKPTLFWPNYVKDVTAVSIGIGLQLINKYITSAQRVINSKVDFGELWSMMTEFLNLELDPIWRN